MSGFDLLQKVVIFHDLTLPEINQVGRICKEETFPGESVIVEEGAPGRAVYILKSGNVKVQKVGSKRTRTLVELSTGEHFGEMALLDDSKTSARVVADGEVHCLVLYRTDFLQLVGSNDKLAAKVYRSFAKTLADRLRKTTYELTIAKTD